MSFAIAESRIDGIPYDTQVRLVNGGTPYNSSGYVEVYTNGQWWPVCNMNQESADSACRQLGYTGADYYNDYTSLS